MESVSSRFLALMNEKGISYGELAKLTGIPKSALQRYATGQTNKIPVDRVERIADALNVSSAMLMGWETASSEDEDLASYLEELRTRPEMKMLFKTSKGMTTEQVKAVVQMLENLKNN